MTKTTGFENLNIGILNLFPPQGVLRSFSNFMLRALFFKVLFQSLVNTVRN